jgi:hypothetical protein
MLRREKCSSASTPNHYIMATGIAIPSMRREKSSGTKNADRTAKALHSSREVATRNVIGWVAGKVSRGHAFAVSAHPRFRSRNAQPQATGSFALLDSVNPKTRLPGGRVALDESSSSWARRRPY